MDSINQTDKQAVKMMLAEMTHCLQRIDNEREQMKDIAEACQEKYKIPKKLFNKLARTMYKHNFSNVQNENDMFTFLYKSIIDGNDSSDEE